MRNRVAYGANAGGAWLRIAAALLALSSMGAGPPVAGPEVTVCDSSLDEEFLEAVSFRVAGGAHGYLAAWHGNPAELASTVIRASRLTSQGAADAGGITLAETMQNRGTLAGPALAAGEDTYLAAWWEKNTKADFTEERKVYGALLDASAQGSLPVPEPLLLAQAPSLTGAPEVAFDAENDRYLVVWRDSLRLEGCWISEDRAMVSAPFQVSGDLAKPVGAEGTLSAACTAGACMVAWEDMRANEEIAVYAAPVGESGAGEEVAIAQTSESVPYGLSLTGDAGSFLLVWAAGVGSARMSAALLDSSGVPQSPAPASLHALGPAELPVLASTAAHQHLVTWVEQTAGNKIIHGAVLGTEGGVEATSEQDLLYLGPDQLPATIACAGAGEACWMAYAGNTEYGPANTPVYGVQVPPMLDGPPQGSHMELTTRVAAQRAPQVACGRTGQCIATWREPTQAMSYGGRVRAALLTPMSAEPLALHAPDAPRMLGFSSTRARLAVASSQLTPEAPARFLAAWIGDTEGPVYVEHQIVIGLVGENGLYQGTLGARTDVEKIGPAVASDGERFVVVWGVGGASGVVIRGTRVGLDGTVLEGEKQGSALVTGVQTNTPPAVVYDGEGFLLVWQTSDGEDRDIYGMRLDTRGETLAAAGKPFRITEGLMSENSQGLGIASEGHGVSLVVWEDGESLRAVRVGASGAQLSESVEIAGGPGFRSTHLQAVFDGQVYLVSWREGLEDDGQVRGTWIGQDGAVLAPEGFSLSDAPPTPAEPGFLEDMALGSDGAGRALLAFVRRRFDDGAGYVDFRQVRARLLGSSCAFGESPVSCVESECRTAGWCDPTAGACAGQAPKADGTACTGGLCVAGECVADPPTDGGSGPAGSGGGAAADGGDSGGCGCRIGEAGSGGSLVVAAAALGALARLGRRRRRSGSSGR